MGIFGWIVLGAVAAWLERRLSPSGARGSFLGSMALAWAGAMLGSLGAYALGLGEFTGFNLRSMLISAAGVVIILVSFRTIRATISRSRTGPGAT